MLSCCHAAMLDSETKGNVEVIFIVFGSKKENERVFQSSFPPRAQDMAIGRAACELLGEI